MSTEPAKPMMLTEEDVHRLLENKSSSIRIELTERFAGSYGRHMLGERDMKVAEQIFRLLLRDTELRVREALAQNVKESDNIPRDIVLSLAQDVEEVALPILQFSQVLTDNDLVELIEKSHEVSRYLAISKRETVSGRITDKLLDTGDDRVAASLVENSGADLSMAAFDRIIAEHGRNESLMRAVSNRPGLPVATVEKLIHIVSSSLAETLERKYNLPTEHIHREVEKTREDETLHLVRMSQSQDEVDKLINQLRAFDRLSPSLILSALCQGNFTFFETSLAVLSNIPVSNARTLITDRGELGFRAIYNKSGLPETMFPAVKLLLRIVRELDTEGEKPGSARYPNRVVERILQYSEDSPIENLSYIIALVRRVAQ